jgi:hypothetical protein
MIDGLFQNKPERSAVANKQIEQDARHKIFSFDLSVLEKSLIFFVIYARSFCHI